MAKKGYWPALALKYYNQREYSKAVELCLMRLKNNPDTLSGRIILARAQFDSGQYDEAEKRFYEVLHYDPENIVALKYLGDLKFKKGEEVTAFSYYEKVLKSDPYTQGLSSRLKPKNSSETKILTLKRGEEKVGKNKKISENKYRELPFKTETIGDLLLAQGHPRLAMNIYRELSEKDECPRINEKLEKSREAIKAGKDRDA